MYIKREIEYAIDSMLKQGKVLLLTGARQVGKTTVLKEHLGSTFNYISMENPRDFALAKQDSVMLFESNELPLIIDEVQRIPELFSTVKWIVDKSKKKGQIILTGSQTYHLMQGVSESLAGRIRILEMPPLSLREITGNINNKKPYIPSKIEKPKQIISNATLWKIINRGSMPELQDDAIDWDSFYSDYIASYLERDVRDLITVKDEAQFYNFMVACAARTGQLFNSSDISNTIDVNHKTVKSWLSVLQASNIIRIIQPFWSNTVKSCIKTPKIYFMDTGLVCHLTRWNTPEQLRRGAMSGHIFETYVVSEILKSHMNAGGNLHDIWFYRDTKKREIDLVIQEGHILHAVEIKQNATITSKDIKNFQLLKDFSDFEFGFSHVVCQTSEPYMIEKDVQAIPVWEI